MTESDILKKINDEAEKSTPDIYDKIETDIEKSNETPVIIFSEKVKKNRTLKRIIAFAAAFVILLSGVIGYAETAAPEAEIILDVNPGISLKCNRRDKVISCSAINDDGKDIIKDMDLRGVPLNVAVNALIGSMIVHGFIDDTKNSILVTVSDDKNNDSDINSRLVTEIDSLINATVGNSAVLSQNIETDKNISSLAEKYNISKGKANLIYAIISGDSRLSFEDLTELSVNELSILAETKIDDNSGISYLGTASKKAYVGYDYATKAASEAFSNAKTVKCEMDYDNGKMIYEVEMLDGTDEYEIDIDAVTGNYLKAEIEITKNNPVFSTGKKMSDENAKRIIRDFAKLPKDVNMTVVKNYINDIEVTNIEYNYEGYSYDFDIDTVTGMIYTMEIECPVSKKSDILLMTEKFYTLIQKTN